MSLCQQLREYIAACFTGLWLQSFEHEDALREIAQLCRTENWRLATWSIDEGLSVPGQASDSSAADPLAAVRSLRALASDTGTAILVLVNFHRFMNSAEIVQALSTQITAGKRHRTFVVILSPVVNIPVELEKQFVILEHELPGREQLEEIARGVATEVGELPESDDLDAVLDAAPGLTLHQGGETFADLGGLEALKSFCTRAMRRQGERHPLKRPRGVLLLSPPGCGKSQFCKALGNETGRP
ncbi:MAG TPA: AAA family ATPase, partial [Pirellulales bacterium]|nr:AAA family ATPase [Pirellulales bacterium]